MSLLSRLEALENATPGITYPDHFISYTVEYGEDEDAKRESVLAEFKQRHQPRPDARFGFIAYRIIEAVDGKAKHPEWAGQP